MKYIALIAVIGILLLQATGSIPLASVGGSLTIGFAFIAAALAVGIHEAWTKKRGVPGWIVNILVSFVGAFVVAPLGGACRGLPGRAGQPLAPAPPPGPPGSGEPVLVVPGSLGSWGDVDEPPV